MIMNCKICNKKTDYLEIHHIVPKSRGGSNYGNNLISICIDCHSLAHDVSFKRDAGLIKSRIKIAKEKEEEAAKWIDENKKIIDKYFDDLYNEDIDKINFINYLMNNTGNFTSLNLKELVLYNKTKMRLII
jgi:hypothetical protein